MVNEEILSGIISALSRGDSIKKAMMSFYNAGYKKEEIEEAAAIAVRSPTQNIPVSSTLSMTSVPSFPKPSQSISQNPSPQKLETNQITNLSKEKPKQKISSYGEKSGPQQIMIIILAALALLLTGIFIMLFIFRNQLVNFFSNLFS